MLNDIFPRDHARYEHSRFGAELDAFAAWLVKQGHLRHPLRLHLFRARRVLERSDCFVSGSMFREPDLREAFVVEGPEAYLYVCTGRIFVRFLAASNRLVREVPVDALSLLRHRYLEYLSGVRGFSAHSVQHHNSTVTDFLSRGLRPGRGLAGLSASDVEAYIQLKSAKNKRQSLQHVVAHIRAFLRYCGDHGEAPVGLHVIDMPRVYRAESPPRALNWLLVRQLLASIRRGDPRGKRDHAILHLMAFYGLRPSEVAALRVDSIDWESGALKVQQSKTRSVLMLPLAGRTLRILRRYLTNARPPSDLPQMFLRVRSPIVALKHYGVIEVFNYRVARSGLPINGASSYSLRHAFAMRLLSRGVGIKTIGDLLGHRSLEATCVYLRIDADMLRTVALPVPFIASMKGGRS
ncbi:MAG: tyrosine-type recombinase/integrase [Burkholderiales bacterium]|nr:tyrosine-type recombinase/integrase [Burkholderiales bacterium]